MRISILFPVALCLASVAPAQDTITSTSGAGSNAEANSGSVSGASNDVANAANNNIGTSTSVSGSNADATSGSISGSASYGNSSTQGQGQEQGQGQGQEQGQELTNNINITTPNTPQTAAGSQGAAQASGTSMATSLSFNTTNRKTTEIRSNPAVPLAASSSFSSDYCGGTMSGGGSASPIGISIGLATPKFDKSCQALRRAEKFGMAAANASNLGQRELADRLMTMMIWSICTSDSSGPHSDASTAQACAMAGLLGAPAVAGSQPAPPPPAPQRARDPVVAMNGSVTPEAAQRAALQANSSANANDNRIALALPR